MIKYVNRFNYSLDSIQLIKLIVIDALQSNYQNTSAYHHNIYFYIYEIMQEYIACFIYTTITLLLPLKETYQAVHSKNEKAVGLWTSYWAIYIVLKFIQSYIGFLTYQPFEFVSMLFLLWCYHSDYKGALLLSSLVRENIKKHEQIAHVINMIHQKLKFLNLFQGETAVESQKQKTN